MMDTERQRLYRQWYNWGWTPEEACKRRTRWFNLQYDWAIFEIAYVNDYEQYYNERRAREAAILPDGVAQ